MSVYMFDNMHNQLYKGAGCGKAARPDSERGQPRKGLICSTGKIWEMKWHGNQYWG